jgi:hypothetical protein
VGWPVERHGKTVLTDVWVMSSKGKLIWAKLTSVRMTPKHLYESRKKGAE